MRGRVLLAAGAALVVGGCLSFYYKGSRVRQSCIEVVAQVKDARNKIDADYALKQRVYDHVKGKGNAAALEQDFAAMTAHRKAFLPVADALVKDSHKVNRRVQNKSKIRKDDPAFSLVKAYQAHVERAEPRLAKEADAYKEASNRFASTVTSQRLVDAAAFEALKKR